VDDAALEKLWADLGTDNELRLERILQGLHSAPQPTVAVLEKLNAAESRALLKDLAGGAPQAALTVNAQAALERLARGDSK
jgi:hypothetical protein